MSDKRIFTDYEIRESIKRERAAKIKVRKSTKCPKCGLYGCICQISINNYINYPSIPTNAPNCPYRCSNQDQKCIECINESHFKRITTKEDILK